MFVQVNFYAIYNQKKRKAMNFKINFISEKTKRNTLMWLMSGVLALALSGVYSIILVAMRTPALQELIPIKDFFKQSLVVHVDLSVLVWLLSILMMMFAALSGARHHLVSLNAAITSIFSVVLLFIAGLMPNSFPMLNNYIPVLINLVFMLGLTFFMCSILLQIGNFSLAAFRISDKEFRDFRFVLFATGLITVVAMACFFVAHKKLAIYVTEVAIPYADYYELLFWGGGHVLQFVYTQTAMITWVVLCQHLYGSYKFGKFFKFLCVLNLIFVLPLPLLYFNVNLPESSYYFTQHMIYFGGIASVLLIISVVISAFLSKNTASSIKCGEWSSFYSSMLMFIIGGAIGYLISETNVTIPAHYHGSIVGVSIALMGLSYYMLEKFDFKNENKKMSFYQPIIYAIGQLLHITGLAWSGGYGVLRKNPEMLLEGKAKIAMGLMGVGGLIAIIGGLLFAYIFIKIFYQNYPKIKLLFTGQE